MAVVDGAAYEEGEFTPVVYFSQFTAAQMSATFSQAPLGYFTRVGNLVTFTIRFTFSSLGTATGESVYIDGLPYANNADFRYGHVIVVENGNLGAGEIFTARTGFNSTIVQLYVSDGDDLTAVTAIDNLTATSFIRVNGTYHIDA